MIQYPIYSGGKFITTDEKLIVTNPYDNSVIAETFRADQNILDESIIAAQSVEKKMASLPSYKKYEILTFISLSLKNDRERLAKVLAQEAGKPLIYALSEIDRASTTFQIAAEEAKRIPGEEIIRLDWTPSGTGKTGYIKKFPVGLVAGISPFNFPLNLAAHKIAPAIAAGCPIILKPASATPLSCLELAKIIDQTDLPKGAVSILPMDRTTGNNLVTDDRFKLLSFTGSPHIGWMMKSQAGEKKVVLELGGNAGAIITLSADIDTIMNRCLIGGFAYAGQVCIHTQRFFVHENHFEAFTQKLCDGAKKLKVGAPIDKNTQFSAMIDEKNAIRVESWVAEAVAEGAQIICGGSRKGSYMEPTILTNVNPKSQVNNEEVFGPVVILEKFTDFSEAITKINDSKFGLQAGVFSNDLREVQQAFDQIEVGGVIINDVPTFRVDHMPYGGIKQSGLGREGVKYAMEDMLESRIMVM